MNITRIETETDYQHALKRLEEIFDAKQDSKKGNELEVLATLIHNYEKIHFPIELPDPIEAIKFRMEQLNYSS
jgi:HTH-type transcriptional regulator/antitoxin HigA